VEVGAPAAPPTKLVWCSVDPVRRKVDFYPRAIASRVEASYSEWTGSAPGQCVLGSDFFNATVHFHPGGMTYQTTPGVSMGRSGFKQPGYRTVKRILLHENEMTATLYAKRVSGEWRFTESSAGAEHTFEEDIPSDSIIDAATGSANDSAVASFRPWSAADMQSMAWDLPVVIWQWCRGVPERNGNLLALSEDWWCPYLEDVNQAIERGFQEGLPSVPVSTIGREFVVKFTPGSSFALQRDQDESRNKERQVRRVVKTVQELKAALERISHPPPSNTALLEQLPPDTVPHHFICPIFQDIMDDPVRTVDGHCYDRRAIETWLLDHHTAPLTGLPLSSKVLAPHTALKDEIAAFVALHHAPPEQPTPP